ncbi:putative nuclease HARBI1 [Heterodontus francisci]|uniref:putative nuclease HARBI1 n=1 Tax=Heterodontus francisci TaxID=7792 RepID=UPI00355AF31C
MAFNFCTSGPFQGSTGDMCEVSQAAHRCIKEVTSALLKRATMCAIKLILTVRQRVPLASGPSLDSPRCKVPFHCTHTAIKALTEQPAAFINRKGFHSPPCVTGLRPLEAHPVGVCLLPGKQPQCLHTSAVPGAIAFQAPRSFAGMDSRDKGHPLKAWLLTPVRNPCTAAVQRYNTYHGSTRANIKQATGLLKMRFRCLHQSGRALQYTPAQVLRIVVVCCALHNPALQSGNALHEEEMIDCQSPTNEEDMEEANERQH